MSLPLEQLFLNYLAQGAALGCAGLLLAAAAPRLARRYAPQWFSRAWALLALLLVLPLGSVGALRALAPVQVQTPPAWQEPIALPRAPAADGAADAAPQRPQAVAEHTVAAQPLPEAEAAPAARAITAPDPLALLTRVWLTGMTGFLLWQGLGYLIWRRRALHPARPAAGPWADAWADTCKEVPLRRRVWLCQTPAVSSPVTAGLLRPVVLVPRPCPAREAARMMLLHERTHLRRHDLALKALLLAARALHWYNPAVTLLARRAGRDLETACDAQVVAGHSPRWRGLYGDALLTAARMGKAPVLTTGFALGKRELKFRFARLWDAAPRRRGLPALALLAAVCVLCTGLIACTADAPAPVGTPAAQTDSGAGVSPAAQATPTPETDHSGAVQRDPALLSTARSQLPAPLPGELGSVSYTLYNGTQLRDRVDLAMADGEGGVSFWHSEDGGATYTAEALDLTPMLGDGPFRVANYEQLTPDTGFLVIARESVAAPGYMTDKNLCFLRQNGGDWQLMSEQSCPAGTEPGGWHTANFYWMNENVGFWAPHTDYHGFDLWRTVDGGASWEKLDLSALESLIPYDDIPGIHTCWADADDLDPAPGSLRVHCNAVDNNSTGTRTFWLISDDYGETWRVRSAYRLNQNLGSPAWLPEFLLDATPVAEGDTQELLSRLDTCRYLDDCTDGQICLTARTRTADGWQDAVPGTPGTLETVYAPAAGGMTARSVREGLATILSDEAQQALLPGLWDGATPTLLERDGRLYIRCADPCSGSQWLQQLSADAKSYTVVTQGAPGQGQGGQGHGQGGQGYGQGGLRQRLRDGTGLCLDLGYTDGCWRLENITKEDDAP